MNRKNHPMGATDLLDAAVGLLRAAPAGLLPYYLGSLPFALALLVFVGDLSRRAVTGAQVSLSALVLALLYVGMKTGQARFGAGVLARLEGRPPVRWGLRGWLRAATNQTALQATGLVLLPAALLLAVPFPWLYAFFQNVTALEDGTDRPLAAQRSRAWRQANLWAGQNHLLLTLAGVLGLLMLVNIAATLMALPFLARKLLAVDTIFTLGGGHLFNTTFLAINATLTHLALDPVIKAAYVLRCFYGQSLGSGADLTASLKGLRAAAASAAAVAVLATTLTAAAPIRVADAAPDAGPGRWVIQPDQLDQRIDELRQRREFSWRLPMERPAEAPPDPGGWLGPFLRWLAHGVKTVIELAVDAWVAVSQWLDELFPDPDPPLEKPSAQEPLAIRPLAFAGIAVLAAVLAVWAWRRWWRRRPQAAAAPPLQPPPPDLHRDDLSADELPAERWRQLARKMTARGERRLALRAHYLATLSQLAAAGLIALALHKSDREYEFELQRRAHATADLSGAFGTTVGDFQRAWYGLHPVSEEMLARFAARQERIQALEAI